MENLNTRIENLYPGGEITISSTNGVVCAAERSGDGKALRFVRTFANGSFEVYKKCSF